MGQQIIPQGNGRFSIFSSSSDSFLAIDMTEQEVVEHFVEAAMRETEISVKEILGKIAAGERPYYQFTRSWEDSYKTHFRTRNCSDKGFNEEIKQLAKELKKAHANKTT